MFAMTIAPQDLTLGTRMTLGTRTCSKRDDSYELKECAGIYHAHFTPEKARLRLENGYFWDDNIDNSTG